MHNNKMFTHLLSSFNGLNKAELFCNNAYFLKQIDKDEAIQKHLKVSLKKAQSWKY